MNKVEVFVSPTCPKCPGAKKTLQEVRREKNFDLEILDVTDPASQRRALMLGIATTPSIVIDGEVKFRGAVPSKREFVNALRK